MSSTGSKKNIRKLELPPERKVELIDGENPKIPIVKQAQFLGLNRSTFYYTPHPRLCHSQEFRERVMARLDYWSVEEPAWGVRTLVPLLRNEGFEVSRELVRELRGEMGLETIYPHANTSKAELNARKMPYLLKNMRKHGMIWLPNLVWAVDITYIKMERSHMYLTAIIDWRSRYLLGWELSDTLETAPVLSAVSLAIKRFGTPAILNSDQGSQFTSDDYKLLLKSNNISQSMDSKGRWADNIAIERWFRSLKIEHIYCNEFNRPRELRRGIAGYIDRYNNVRPHQSLGDRTPADVYGDCFKNAI